MFHHLNADEPSKFFNNASSERIILSLCKLRGMQVWKFSLRLMNTNHYQCFIFVELQNRYYYKILIQFIAISISLCYHIRPISYELDLNLQCNSKNVYLKMNLAFTKSLIFPFSSICKPQKYHLQYSSFLHYMYFQLFPHHSNPFIFLLFDTST